MLRRPTILTRRTSHQLQPISALLALAPKIKWISGRHIHRINQLHPEALARAPRGEIIGVTSNPQRMQSMVLRDGQEQPTGALSEVMPAMVREDVITNVTVIEQDVVGVADAQADATGAVAGG